jgi:microcin C transport system permease protein
MDSRQSEIFWKNGGLALVVWLTLSLLCVFAELWAGNRALFVAYQGRVYFPLFQGQLPGRTFGLPYDYETDYRELEKLSHTSPPTPNPSLREGNLDMGAAPPNPTGNTSDFYPSSSSATTAKAPFVLLPLIPYSPIENSLSLTNPNAYAPSPPDFASTHYLGTDPLGRDILVRLVYGYRNALIFASLYLVGLMVIGTLLGVAFGYYGGLFDFLGQRLIEIWSNIPFIYVVMIVASIISPNLFWLVVLSLVFGWTGIAAFVRALSFREKTRDFVLAAKASGSSDFRIITRHILPQLGGILLTFLPYQAVGAITTLTSLDFLGFGLKPPEASWGELLSTGSGSLQAPWIVSSVVAAMTLVLVLLTIIGNALREALDPKTLLRYR